MKPQIFVSNKKPKPSMVNQISNRNHSKPSGGVWTSPQRTDCISAYEQFESGALVQSDQTVWRLSPKKGCNIFEVNCVEDLGELPETEPIGTFDETYIDFEELFSSGVHGLYINGSVAHKKGFSSEYNLYGWDFECVLWRSLEWVDRVKELGKVRELSNNF